MMAMSKAQKSAERYATDFMQQLHLNENVNQQCEWTCLLWSKELWANKAKKGQVDSQLAKEQAPPHSDTHFGDPIQDGQFLNTVAQVYGKLFGAQAESCSVKVFHTCPYMTQRGDLLRWGSLASVFVTVLHKAMTSAMTDRHPLDSGLIGEEYEDVYGVDLTNFQDLEGSLADGRFEVLYQSVLKHAKQVAGIPWFTDEELQELKQNNQTDIIG